MKFVALISGGKDSIYSIQQAITQHNHELLCTAYIHPPSNNKEPTDDESSATTTITSNKTLESDSYMFQSAAHNVISTISNECLEVPCYTRISEGSSISISLQYTTITEKDEVEDLYQLLSLVKENHPDVQGVAAGAILSTYQRIRLEHVCSRLNLTSLSLLWRIGPQPTLLSCMVEDHIEAILVKVATPGLSPKTCLGKSIGEMTPLFHKLKKKFQFQVCGEGGEYETLVVDCPIYKRRLIIEESEVVYLDGNEKDDDGRNYDGMVGVLNIIKFHTEEKKEKDELIDHGGLVARIRSQNEECIPWNSLDDIKKRDQAQGTNNITRTPSIKSYPSITTMPHAKIQSSSGIIHISSLVSPNKHNNDAVSEFQEILSVLKQFFEYYQVTSQDVVIVHLYLSEISLFAQMNIHYKKFFGVILPPSRSCVALGKEVLEMNRNVMLDLIVQKNSGNSMRNQSEDTTINLRNVLHVQGISNWAPICVGPYSQANTLRQGLTFYAGQIGLIPCSMTLPTTWEEQLIQAWKNIANVIDALEQCLISQITLGVLLYIHPTVQDWNLVYDISTDAIKKNAGIIPGFVDEKATTTSDDQSLPPIIMISIPEMPMGALVEIEIIACTKKAIDALPLKCLDDSNYHSLTSHNMDTNSDDTAWDCDSMSNIISTPNHNTLSSDHTIQVSCRYLEQSVSVLNMNVMIDKPENISNTILSIHTTCQDIFQCLLQTMTKTQLQPNHVLHIRFYYIPTVASLEQIKQSFFVKLGRIFQSVNDTPAVTFVPVLALERNAIFSVQVIMCDLKHLETEIWVRSPR